MNRTVSGFGVGVGGGVGQEDPMQGVGEGGGVGQDDPTQGVTVGGGVGQDGPMQGVTVGGGVGQDNPTQGVGDGVPPVSLVAKLEKPVVWNVSVRAAESYWASVHLPEAMQSWPRWMTAVGKAANSSRTNKRGICA